MSSDDKGIGLHEPRTRVFCHLPINNRNEWQAVDAVIAHIESLQEDRSLGVKGYTKTRPRPPAFLGYWWNSRKKEFEEESIVICIVDIKLDISDSRLNQITRDLRDEIRKQYVEFTGKEQQVVWVVAHEVYRYD